MSNNYGPTIVRDGLVLCLDAANSKSYPGSGTTWTDLSGNGNDCVITNGPTHSTDNFGTFTFDGSNDYVLIPYNSSMDNVNTTLSVWIKSTFAIGPRTRHYIFDGLGHKSMIFVDEPNEINFVVRIGGVSKYTYYNNSEVSDNVWCNITGTYDGSICKLYFNGNLVDSLSTTGNIDTAPNSAGRIMDYIGGNYNTEGLASNFMMYNRGINELEVKQNFNALRGRYGI